MALKNERKKTNNKRRKKKTGAQQFPEDPPHVQGCVISSVISRFKALRLRREHIWASSMGETNFHLPEDLGILGHATDRVEEATI